MLYMALCNEMYDLWDRRIELVNSKCLHLDLSCCVVHDLFDVMSLPITMPLSAIQFEQWHKFLRFQVRLTAVPLIQTSSALHVSAFSLDTREPTPRSKSIFKGWQCLFYTWTVCHLFIIQPSVTKVLKALKKPKLHPYPLYLTMQWYGIRYLLCHSQLSEWVFLIPTFPKCTASANVPVLQPAIFV